MNWIVDAVALDDRRTVRIQDGVCLFNGVSLHHHRVSEHTFLCKKAGIRESKVSLFMRRARIGRGRVQAPCLNVGHWAVARTSSYALSFSLHLLDASSCLLAAQAEVVDTSLPIMNDDVRSHYQVITGYNQHLR